MTFEIKPYKENELGVSHRQGFLANFSSISEPILYSIRGNKSSIRLFLHVPSKYEKYVENVFYSSFPTTDISKLEYEMDISTKGHSFFKFSPECTFYKYSEFSDAGSYVDPFKDVLTSFFTVPDDAELVVQYTNVFDAKESFWQKLLKRIGKLFKLFGGKREEKSDKELKDEKHEQEVKKVERDVLFSISIATSGLQKPAVSKLQSDLLNVYDKFLHE